MKMIAQHENVSYQKREEDNVNKSTTGYKTVSNKIN